MKLRFDMKREGLKGFERNTAWFDLQWLKYEQNF